MGILPRCQVGLKKRIGRKAADNKLCVWRSEVLVAEAKKAGSASECTCLIPRPSCRIGKLACNHWISEMSVLEIWLKADLRVASKDARPKWSTDGEHLNKC